jgi:hypothetical protein
LEEGLSGAEGSCPVERQVERRERAGAARGVGDHWCPRGSTPPRLQGRDHHQPDPARVGRHGREGHPRRAAGVGVEDPQGRVAPHRVRRSLERRPRARRADGQVVPTPRPPARWQGGEHQGALPALRLPHLRALREATDRHPSRPRPQPGVLLPRAQGAGRRRLHQRHGRAGHRDARGGCSGRCATRSRSRPSPIT